MAVMVNQGVPVQGDWEVSVHLRGDGQAPWLCRKAVVHAVRAYGVGELADAAELVVSELVTNAVRYGDGRLALRVTWQALRERLRVTVWDEGAGRAPARPVRPPDHQESGRGLLVVAAMAREWGQYGMPGSGKALWAELVPG